jgi:PKD repeat protein
MANTLCRTEKGIAIALVLVLTVPLLVMGSTSASASPEPIALSLRGDCLIAPHFSSNRLVFSAPGPPEPGFDDTSEFMIGSVSVELIFLESDGTIDPKTETWTDPMKTEVYDEVQAGVSWWATNPLGPQFNFTLHSRTVTTGYEPINRPQTDEGLWINETMTKMGYSSGNYFYETKSYINDMRASDGNDWGYVIFMVNSLNDADGRFSDGLFAYSYLGGPFLVMTYDNDGWGIARMNQVAAHEMGHMFYATDEYDGIPQFSGYLNSLEIEGSGCIMDTSLSLSISNGTLRQIGWYDSDGDGVFDIVDTEPEVTLTSIPLQYSNSSLANYSGTASVIPYPNHNPLGPGNDVTVAKIAQVFYSLDGSGWMAADASDGTYDQTTEAFDFSFAPTDGFHSVSVTAVTDQGVYSGSSADDDFYADRTEPTSSAQPLPAYTNSSTFAVQGNASDDLGLSSVELWYSRNGTGYSLYSTLFTPPWQWQFDSSMTGGEGAYDFYTMATDIAGNRESQPSVPDASTIVNASNPVPIVASFLTTANYLDVTVDASASSDVDGIIVSYAWDFGDGGTATGMIVVHTYALEGTYTITLTVTDNFGLTDTESENVFVSADVSFELTLVSGWNLVTVPLVGSNYKASTLGLMTDDVVSGWNSSSMAYDKNFIVNRSPSRNDFTIAEGTGFWIHVNVRETILLNGSIPTTTQTITVTVPAGGGWALVGFLGLNTTMHASDISEMYSGGDVTTVASYNTATGQYEVYITNVPHTDFLLVPGQAYWIYCDASGALTYDPL